MAEHTQDPPSLAEFNAAPSTPYVDTDQPPSLAEFDAAPGADQQPPSGPFVNAPSVSGSPSLQGGGPWASPLKPGGRGAPMNEVVPAKQPGIDDFEEALRNGMPRQGIAGVVDGAAGSRPEFDPTAANTAVAKERQRKKKELDHAMAASVSDEMPFSTIQSASREIPTLLPYGPETLKIDPREEHLSRSYYNWLKVADPSKVEAMERKIQPGDKWQEAMNPFTEADQMDWRLGMLDHQGKAFQAFVDKAGGFDNLSPAGQQEVNEGIAYINAQMKEVPKMYPEAWSKAVEDHAAQASKDIMYAFAKANPWLPISPAIVADEQVVKPFAGTFAAFGGSLLKMKNFIEDDPEGYKEVQDKMDAMIGPQGIYGGATRTQGAVFADGGIDYEKVMPRLSEQMANLMIFAGAGTAGKLPLYATSYAMTHEQYFREGMEAGLTDVQASNLALVGANVQSGLEFISPLEFGATKREFGRIMSQSVKDIAKGVSTKRAFEPMAKYVAKNMAKEVTQEYSQDAADLGTAAATNMLLGRQVLDDSYSMERFMETGFLTAVTTGLFSGVQGRRMSPLYHESVLWAVNKPEQFVAALGNEKGLTADQKKIASERVGMYRKVLAGLPDGPMTSQRMRVADLAVEAELLKKQKAEATVDPTVASVAGDPFEAKEKANAQAIKEALGVKDTPAPTVKWTGDNVQSTNNEKLTKKADDGNGSVHGEVHAEPGQDNAGITVPPNPGERSSGTGKPDVATAQTGSTDGTVPQGIRTDGNIPAPSGGQREVPTAEATDEEAAPGGSPEGKPADENAVGDDDADLAILGLAPKKKAKPAKQPVAEVPKAAPKIAEPIPPRSTGYRLIEDVSDEPQDLASAYIDDMHDYHDDGNPQSVLSALTTANVDKNSYVRFGDRNNITASFAKTYFRKRGRTIDDIAQEASDITGREITPDDVVEFMHDNPGGRPMRSERMAELADRYKEVTGKKLNKLSAKALLKKARRNPIARAAIVTGLDESDVIEHYKQAQEEWDAYTDEQKQAIFDQHEQAEKAIYEATPDEGAGEVGGSVPRGIDSQEEEGRSPGEEVATPVDKEREALVENLDAAKKERASFEKKFRKRGESLFDEGQVQTKKDRDTGKKAEPGLFEEEGDTRANSSDDFAKAVKPYDDAVTVAQRALDEHDAKAGDRKAAEAAQTRVDEAATAKKKGLRGGEAGTAYAPNSEPGADVYLGEVEQVAKGIVATKGVSDSPPLIEAMAKSDAANDVLYLDNKPTGWKIFQTQEWQVVIISNDGKKYKRFLAENKRSGTDYQIAHAYAVAWAFDNPYKVTTNDLPNNRIVTKPLFAKNQTLADEAQAKPATSSATDSGTILEQRTGNAPELIAQHNISAEKLLHASRMGGLAVPSLAITKVGDPLEGFGEITLLGDADMIDPKGPNKTKVFGADIYSPRYPRVTHIVPSKNVLALNQRLGPYVKKFGGHTYYTDDLSDGAKALKDNAAVMAAFLDAIGISVEPVMRDGQVSEYQTQQKLRTAIEEGGGGKYDAFLDDLMASLETKEKLFKGFTYSGNRRYEDHNLDNVVRVLKKELRAGEGFNYGPGTIRAKFTPQFRSLGAIRKAKDRLVSKEEFEKVKEEVGNDLEKISAELAPYYEHDSNRFGFLDTVSNVIMDASKIGLGRALKEYDFNEVPDNVRGAVADYMDKLVNLPSEYFEAKITRAVPLQEFKVAVIPSNASEKVRAALKRHGLEVVEYDKSKEGDRQRAIESVARGNKLLFQQHSKSSTTPTTGITHVDEVIRALGEVAPGTKVHTYTNNAEYNRQAKERGGKSGQHSSAFYDNRDGSIHINLNRAKDNTLFHEAAHPVLKAVIAENPELLHGLYDQLADHPDFGKYKKFAERYEEDQRKVEAVVEYMADIAAGKARSSALPNSMYQKFKAWVKDLLNKLGFRGVKLDPANLKQFAEDFATAVTEGRKIRMQQKASSVQEGMSVFAQTYGITVEEAKRQYDEVVSRYTNPDGTKKDGWMKAPNGKPTNLNEVQWVQTRTPAFLNWFGDFLNDPKNASKVVDANGDPLVVYHGTKGDIEEFDVNRLTKNTSAKSADLGFFFTDFTYTADKFAGYSEVGGSVVPVYLKMDKPTIDTSSDFREKRDSEGFKTGTKIVDRYGVPIVEKDAYEKLRETVLSYGMEYGAFREKSISLGYDGVILRGTKMDGMGDISTHYVVFAPNQIKSATGNTGQYDPANPNINEQLTDKEGNNLDPSEVAARAKKANIPAAKVRAIMERNGEDEADIRAVEKAMEYGELPFDPPHVQAPSTPMSDEQAAEKHNTVAKKEQEDFKKAIVPWRTRIYRSWIRNVEDPTGIVKEALRKQGADRVVDYRNLVSGAGGKAKFIYDEARHEIHHGLTVKEKGMLDDVIRARRIISIDTRYDNDLRERIKHPGGLDKESSEGYLNHLKATDTKLYNDLMKRADAYFSVMKDALDAMHKSGLVGKEGYEAMRGDEYSPRKFIHHMLDGEAAMGYSDKEGFTRAIKSLDGGSEESMYNNSEWLLANYIGSVYGRIAMNDANRSLLDFAEQKPDNGIVSVVKPIGEGKYPSQKSGDVRVGAFVDGKLKYMDMDAVMGRSWMKSDPVIRQDVANTLRVISGGALTRLFTTGVNTAFTLSNIPRDMGHVLLFTNNYSRHLPVAAAQLVGDMGTVMIDALLRKGKYRNFVMQGGSLDYLARQGNPFQGGGISVKGSIRDRITRGYDTAFNVLSYINESSEIVTRLAVRDRYISNAVDEYTKENGHPPTGEAMEEIEERGTAAAREYMDFNQGGLYAKGADTVLPYLNASLQGTRVMARYAKNNPKVFAYKVAQAMGLAAALMAYNLSGDDDDKKDEWNKIPDFDKENNYVVLLPAWKRDSDGAVGRYYLKFPKTQDQRIYSTMAEAMVEYAITGKLPTKRAVQSFKDNMPFLPTDVLNIPVVNSMFAYATGFDTYRDEYVVDPTRNIEPWAESRTNTPQFFKDLGKWTSVVDEEGNRTGGISPEKARLATEKLAGLSKSNMFSVILDGAYTQARALLSDGDKAAADKLLVKQLGNLTGSFTHRYLGVTSDRDGHEKLDRYSREEQTRRAVVNNQVRDLLGKFRDADGVPERKTVNADAMKYFNTLPEDERKRAYDRYKLGIKHVSVPYEFIDLYYEKSAAVKAKYFIDMYTSASERKKRDMVKHANEINLFTPSVMKKIREGVQASEAR